MIYKPSNAFIAAAWIALGIGMIGYIIGLWRSDMELNEKGYYFTVLMFGLFAVISLQKAVRDKLEGIPVTEIYYGISWFSTILTITLLIIDYGMQNSCQVKKVFMPLLFYSLSSEQLPYKKTQEIVSFRPITKPKLTHF
ncbi:YiaA/YiaB family inner membrane protein [Pedobacter polaris]